MKATCSDPGGPFSGRDCCASAPPPTPFTSSTATAVFASELYQHGTGGWLSTSFFATAGSSTFPITSFIYRTSGFSERARGRRQRAIGRGRRRNPRRQGRHRHAGPHRPAHPRLWGGTSLGVDAEDFARRSAVTTCVDTGSAGPGNSPASESVIERSAVRILPYLQVSLAVSMASRGGSWWARVMTSGCRRARVRRSGGGQPRPDRWNQGAHRTHGQRRRRDRAARRRRAGGRLPRSANDGAHRRRRPPTRPSSSACARGTF